MYCATVFFNLEVSELGREFRVGPVWQIFDDLQSFDELFVTVVRK